MFKDGFCLELTVDLDIGCGEVFVNGDGEAGNDKGEERRKGDVGVPRLDGRESLDSDDTNVLVGMSLFSEGSGVQRTVGKVIFRVLFLNVSSASGESAILI